MFSNFTQVRSSALPTANVSVFNMADPAGECCGVRTQQETKSNNAVYGGKPEVFNSKTIKMPKMVVKNAPVINPWYGMKH